MTRTRIRLPDALHRDLKQFAASREWSLAETLRRAAEQFLARHPVRPEPAGEWRVPVSDAVGWGGLDDEAVRAASHEDCARRPTEIALRDGASRDAARKVAQEVARKVAGMSNDLG